MPEPTPLRGTVPWPDPPDEAAYHGLAGQIVREVLPHTEADPVALLATFLACVGNAMGTRPHYRVGGARHELRLYPVLVGATSSGRKGTAIDTLGPIFEAALPDWWGRRTKGMVSGEGLIYHVRDAVSEQKPRKIQGTTVSYETVVSDPGAPDRRLLIVEKEFGGILRVLTRENNTLSPVIRDAWDGGPMATLAKNSATRASSSHITILGHITPEELTELLGSTEAYNGFANRFLWFCVRRSKFLPHGGELEDNAILAIGEVVKAAIEQGAGLARLRLDAAARPAWERVYEPLATGEPGLVGALLSRAAPYVMRLAGTYAALDAAPAIGLPHLEAALALWGHADASVRHIFAPLPAQGISPYRRTILDALAGGSLTQGEIGNDLFGGNLRPPEPHATLDALLGEGLVERAFERPASGRGRNVTRWSLTEKGKEGRAG